ncbi:MAG: O-antigen ligase family protein [Mobilitalea sp.]
MPNNNTNHKAQNKLSNNQVKSKQNSFKPYKIKKSSDQVLPNYHMILIFFILCVIPFIVRMKIYDPNMMQFNWFADSNSVADVFLYYKQWTLVVVASIMVIVIGYKSYYERRKLRFSPTFIPLAIYGLLALLSSVFSKYASFSFAGSFEQFESVFALLGYCIIAYYAFLFIGSEHDLKKIEIYLIVVALIMSILGVFQYMGMDFFGTKAAYNLIVPASYQSDSELAFKFEENRVFLTLYNPNYVGSYVALVAPIILVMLFFQRNIKNIILSVTALIGLIVCVVGAQSLAGIMGLITAVICIIIFMWRYLMKRYYITIPVFLVLMIGLVILNNQTDQLLINKVINTVKNSESNFLLTQMDTNDNNISLTYNNKRMYIQYILNEDNTASIIAVDDNSQNIEAIFDSATNSIIITDERFTGITFGVSADKAGVFYIQESGVQWLFTNQTGDGIYYHLNRMGKLDKMITAPSAVFTGYEWFASARGYIWSRTIPVLKNYLFLGSGPDTFIMAFPKQDYINFTRYGYANGVFTKPHNLYLQIATQTGILSLIAFLTFYVMYFASSVRLYIKGRYNNFYAQIGVAIFIGTIAYMVTGLTNDSSITTAPIFWALIGIGLSVNYKVKSLIRAEADVVK